MNDEDSELVFAEDPVTVGPVPGLPTVGSRLSYGNSPGWTWLVTDSSNGLLYLELYTPEGRHAGAAEPMVWPANRWPAFLTKFNAAPIPEEG